MELESVSVYNIFIFFLIISSNYLGELFPCRIQKLLSSNMLFKHLFGFFTLSFFVVLTDKTATSERFKYVISSSFMIYCIFLVFVKTHIYFFGFALFIALLIYILNIKINELNDNIKHHDKGESDQQIIFNNTDNFIAQLEQINKIATYIFYTTIVIGFLIYMGEKKIEYKNKFNYLTFVFGKPNCKGESPNTTIFKAIKTAF
jgi:hypothetical protein